MDLFVIHGIVGELNEEITGGFIAKVYQMNRTDLLFRLRLRGEEKQLLISTHPNFYRLHLTEKKYPNPPVPPRFCTYLRKHITGARVTEVSQDPYERVIRVGLQKRMDAGITRDLVLVTELVSKGSNVLLLEGEKILDCLHFRRPEDGSARPAAPGLMYSPPPPRSRWPMEEVNQEKMGEIASLPPGKRWQGIKEKVAGIGASLAREIEFLSDGTVSDLGKVFGHFLEVYRKNDFEPRILTLLGEKRILSPFPLKSLGEVAEEVYPSMNRAADAYYFETVMQRQMAERKQGMAKRVRQLLSRLQRRRENLQQDREKLEKDLELKAYGDILTANYPRLKKGMREVEAMDFRQDPPRPILISLDEALDPSGNVQRYFKKYKKAKRGLELTSQRLSETERETAYLDSVLFQMEEAEDAEELEAIRRELEEERILPLAGRRQGKKEKGEPALPLRRFSSTEGLEIFCGKHNVGNDYLLRRVAKDKDLWFHAQGVPGSHVILKVGPKEPKLESILEAAAVAAYYSRGKGSTRLPVDYTEVKNVHRPHGAKPGVVNYFHQKTVYVEPNKGKVEKLTEI